MISLLFPIMTFTLVLVGGIYAFIAISNQQKLASSLQRNHTAVESQLKLHQAKPAVFRSRFQE